MSRFFLFWRKLKNEGVSAWKPRFSAYSSWYTKMRGFLCKNSSHFWDFAKIKNIHNIKTLDSDQLSLHTFFSTTKLIFHLSVLGVQLIIGLGRRKELIKKKFFWQNYFKSIAAPISERLFLISFHDMLKKDCLLYITNICCVLLLKKQKKNLLISRRISGIRQDDAGLSGIRLENTIRHIPTMFEPAFCSGLWCDRYTPPALSSSRCGRQNTDNSGI